MDRCRLQSIALEECRQARARDLRQSHGLRQLRGFGKAGRGVEITRGDAWQPRRDVQSAVRRKAPLDGLTQTNRLCAASRA